MDRRIDWDSIGLAKEWLHWARQHFLGEHESAEESRMKALDWCARSSKVERQARRQSHLLTTRIIIRPLRHSWYVHLGIDVFWISHLLPQWSFRRIPSSSSSSSSSSASAIKADGFSDRLKHWRMVFCANFMLKSSVLSRIYITTELHWRASRTGRKSCMTNGILLDPEWINEFPTLVTHHLRP